MHLQVLSSGSKGNSTLVRAGETTLLLDAGLPVEEQLQRMENAGCGLRGVHHLALTHGHLDHARAAGILGRRSHTLTVHCCERLMGNKSVRRARRLATLNVGRPSELADPRGRDPVRLLPVKIPHDADPTVAFRVEHGGRSAVVLTDMGRPAPEATRALANADLLVLEFNHDPAMLAEGPYKDSLKKRVAGNGGHLSNAQAAEVLRQLAGPRLHTVVLAHLSETNNRPLLALEAARAALLELGRADVRVLIAEQGVVGPNLEV
jgi:phosphoribosyl 1,2-cyclic phosphodiesterase